MYPAGELSQLAVAKARLQGRIRVRRELVAISGRQVAATIDRIDLWRQRIQRWRGLLPLVLPFVFRARTPRSKFGSLLKWAPVVLKVYQGWRRFAAGSGDRPAAAPAETNAD
jgi:hypothetical protein